MASNKVLNLVRGSTTLVTLTTLKEDGAAENLTGFQSATLVVKETIEQDAAQVIGVTSGISYTSPNLLNVSIIVPGSLSPGDYFGQLRVVIAGVTYPSKPFKVRILENLGAAT